jgi:hypothetical protein
MRSYLTAGVGFVLVLCAAGVARASSVSAQVDYTVTVSGAWGNLNVNGNSPYFYVVSQVGGIPALGVPGVGTMSTPNASAAYAVNPLQVSAPEAPASISIGQTASAAVWGIGNSPDMGDALVQTFSLFGSGLVSMRALAGDPVTVTASYSYTIDGSQAVSDWLALIEMDLQVIDGHTGAAQLAAVDSPGWSINSAGDWALLDSLGGATAGKDTGVQLLTATWTFTPVAGSVYYLRAAASAGALELPAAVPEPVTLFSAIMGSSSLGLYIRKRRRSNGGV